MPRVYTIGEAAEALGMPASTIRFYDKNGLLPDLSRSQGGTRVFTDEDLEWARFVERLKQSGMPIREMRDFVELFRQGDETVSERRRILHERREALTSQMSELQDALDLITYKCWFYDVAEAGGGMEAARSVADEDMPPEMLALKRKCGL